MNSDFYIYGVLIPGFGSEVEIGIPIFSNGQSMHMQIVNDDGEVEIQDVTGAHFHDAVLFSSGLKDNRSINLKTRLFALVYNRQVISINDADTIVEMSFNIFRNDLTKIIYVVSELSHECQGLNRAIVGDLINGALKIRRLPIAPNNAYAEFDKTIFGIVDRIVAWKWWSWGSRQRSVFGGQYIKNLVARYFYNNSTDSLLTVAAVTFLACSLRDKNAVFTMQILRNDIARMLIRKNRTISNKKRIRDKDIIQYNVDTYAITQEHTYNMMIYGAYLSELKTEREISMDEIKLVNNHLINYLQWQHTISVKNEEFRLISSAVNDLTSR